MQTLGFESPTFTRDDVKLLKKSRVDRGGPNRGGRPFGDRNMQLNEIFYSDVEVRKRAVKAREKEEREQQEKQKLQPPAEVETVESTSPIKSKWQGVLRKRTRTSELSENTIVLD